VGVNCIVFDAMLAEALFVVLLLVLLLLGAEDVDAFVIDGLLETDVRGFAADTLAELEALVVFVAVVLDAVLVTADFCAAAVAAAFCAAAVAAAFCAAAFCAAAFCAAAAAALWAAISVVVVLVAATAKIGDSAPK
jgi:hypothetical protein